MWLSFPAALIVLAIILLLATIVKSTTQQRSQQQQIWKSSLLALMFHGLDQEVRARYPLVDDEVEMQKAAKGLVVKIGCDDFGGVGFVGAQKTET